MPKPTIVLVHGAWADGSSWNAVASAVRGQGFPVFTPPNLLRRVSVDAPCIASFVAQRSSGPVALVGRSYGGCVVTNATTGGDAQDLPEDDRWLVVESQRPITLSANTTPSGARVEVAGSMVSHPQATIDAILAAATAVSAA